MKSIATRAVAAALLVVSTAGVACAESITFSFVGASMKTGNGNPPNTEPAGSLTGTFTVNFTLSGNTVTGASLTSADIIAPAESPAGFSYAGNEYKYGIAGANSTLAQSLPTQYFQLDDGNNELRIDFSNTSPLTPSGAPILTGGFSYEYELGVTRFVSAGSVLPSVIPAAVPEPASIALMSSALAIVLGGARVCRRRAGSTIAR